MSAELEKSIKEIVDRRIDDLYGKGFKDIAVILNKIETKMSDLEKRLEELELTVPESEQLTRRFRPIEKDIEVIKETLSIDELENLMAKVLLGVVPDFNKKIAAMIKDHMVAIAEFVIENFKEKD